MTDSVPVSPAAQAVETDAQAAAERVAAFLGSRYSSADPVAKTAVDTGPGPLDYYVAELRRADLHALVTAVRLVPAPGPDTDLPAADTRLPASDVLAWWGRGGVFIGTGSRVFIGHPFGDSREVPNPEATARALLAAGREAMDVRTDGETPQ